MDSRRRNPAIDQSQLIIKETHSDLTCPTVTELEVSDALKRRALAFDLVGVCTYNIMAGYHADLLDHLRTPPPPDTIQNQPPCCNSASEISLFPLSPFFPFFPLPSPPLSYALCHLLGCSTDRAARKATGVVSQLFRAMRHWSKQKKATATGVAKKASLRSASRVTARMASARVRFLFEVSVRMRERWPSGFSFTD